MAEDIFAGFGKSISKAAQKAADTTSSFFEASKIRAQITGEQKEIGKLYQKIGETVFRTFDGDAVKLGDSEKAVIEEIKAHMAAIAELKGVLASVKGMKVCPSCEELIDADVAFCPKCGAPTPVPAASEAEEAAGDAAGKAADAAGVAEEAPEAAEKVAEKAADVKEATAEEASEVTEKMAEKAEDVKEAAAEKASEAAQAVAEKAAGDAGTVPEDAAVDAEFQQIEETAEAAEAVDAEFTPIPDDAPEGHA